MIEQLLLTE